MTTWGAVQPAVHGSGPIAVCHSTALRSVRERPTQRRGCLSQNRCAHASFRWRKVLRSVIQGPWSFRHYQTFILLEFPPTCAACSPCDTVYRLRRYSARRSVPVGVELRRPSIAFNVRTASNNCRELSLQLRLFTMHHCFGPSVSLLDAEPLAFPQYVAAVHRCACAASTSGVVGHCVFLRIRIARRYRRHRNDDACALPVGIRFAVALSAASSDAPSTASTRDADLPANGGNMRRTTKMLNTKPHTVTREWMATRSRFVFYPAHRLPALLRCAWRLPRASAAAFLVRDFVQLARRV